MKRATITPIANCTPQFFCVAAHALPITMLLSLTLGIVAGCGQNSSRADRQYVAEVVRIGNNTLRRDRLSGLSAQQVARQYFQFAKELKSLRTVGVSKELFKAAHHWADACAREAQAIENVVAVPNDNAIVGDGIVRMILGENPSSIYARASGHVEQGRQAMQELYAAQNSEELGRSDFARVVHDLGIE